MCQNALGAAAKVISSEIVRGAVLAKVALHPRYAFDAELRVTLPDFVIHASPATLFAIDAASTDIFHQGGKSI